MSALPLPVEVPIVDPLVGGVTDSLPLPDLALPTVSLTVGNDSSAAGVAVDSTGVATGGAVSLA